MRSPRSGAASRLRRRPHPGSAESHFRSSHRAPNRRPDSLNTRRGNVHVGTVGWSYPDWKGCFYPKGTAARDYLAFYAGRFRAVEVDSTFYAWPKRTNLQQWAEKVPPGFRFALKAPQSITHERLLAGCAEDMLRFLDSVQLLGDALGPVILQLPARFGRSHLKDLFRLLEALPPKPGIAVEFRHRSCYSSEMFEVLRNRGVGLVTTDAHEGFLLSGPDVVLRLMGERDTATRFDRVVVDKGHDLDAWADRVGQLPAWVEHAYLFVNNLYSGHAPETAAALGVRLGVLDPPPAPPGTQESLFP